MMEVGCGEKARTKGPDLPYGRTQAKGPRRHTWAEGVEMG